MHPFVKCALASLGAWALAAAPASADTILGPVWPGPGNPTVGSSGSGAGFTGGKTWSYSSFNTANYTDLWFGTNPTLPLQLSMDGSTHNLSFNNFTSSAVTWTGSTSMSYLSGSTLLSKNVDTEFVLSTSDATFTSDPGGIGNFADIHVTGDFHVNFFFGARDAGSSGAFLPANEYYNQYNHPTGTISSSAAGAFFYTAPAAPVPLPSAAWGGLLLLGAVVATRHLKTARVTG